MSNQLITHRLPIDYSLISLMSSISYVWLLPPLLASWMIHAQIYHVKCMARKYHHFHTRQRVHLVGQCSFYPFLVYVFFYRCQCFIPSQWTVFFITLYTVRVLYLSAFFYTQSVVRSPYFILTG